MKISAIIAEFNPLHRGHIYLLQKAREMTECDCLVVILSGYFSQRGLPSLLSKEDKAELALKHGADLVLECPSCYAMQSADYFARYMMESLSCLPVNMLCFGSESDDPDSLYRILDESENVEIDPSVSINRNRQRTIRPNDLLGLHYIKYCKEYDIKPVLVKRMPQYKSATQTRADFFAGKETDFSALFHPEQNWNSYYPYLRLMLMMTSESDLRSFHLVSEGIENRLKQAAFQYSDWDSFLSYCTTRNYSRARIQRTCMMILLQMKKSDMKDASFHRLKVLGFNKTGQECLRSARPGTVISRFQDMDPFLRSEHIRSLALYNSVLKEPVKEKGVIRYGF